MTGSVDAVPDCDRCDTAAAFWVYRPDRPGWRPLCERHTVHLHPSIEVRAWLTSGYAKPVELGRPTAPPDPPAGGRERAFRDLLDRVLEDPSRDCR